MSHSAYDQGPPQGDMGAYSNYETAPPQDPFLQNGSYGGGPSAQFTAPPPPTSSDGYNQGYGNFEGALEIKTEHKSRAKYRGFRS